MARISLQGAISKGFVERLQNISSNYASSSQSTSPFGGASKTSISESLRIGAQIYTKSIAGLNQVSDVLTLSKDALEKLAKITDELIVVTERATKIGIGYHQSRRLDQRFQKLADEFEEIIEETDDATRQYLKKEGLAEAFELIGLKQDTAKKLASLFEDFVIAPKDEDEYLASDYSKPAVRKPIPKSAFERTIGSGDGEFSIEQLTTANANASGYGTGVQTSSNNESGLGMGFAAESQETAFDSDSTAGTAPTFSATSQKTSNDPTSSAGTSPTYGAITTVSANDATNTGQGGFITTDYNIYETDNSGGTEYVYVDPTSGGSANVNSATYAVTLKAVDKTTGYYVIESQEDFLTGQNATNSYALFLVDNTGTVVDQIGKNTNGYGLVDISEDIGGIGEYHIAYERINVSDRTVYYANKDSADWGTGSGLVSYSMGKIDSGTASDVQISDSGSFVAYSKSDNPGEVFIHRDFSLQSVGTSLTGADLGFDKFAFIDETLLLVAQDTDSDGTADTLFEYDIGQKQIVRKIEEGLSIQHLESVQKNSNGEYFYAYSVNSGTDQNDVFIKNHLGEGVKVSDRSSTLDTIESLSLTWNSTADGVDVGIYGLLNDQDATYSQLYRIDNATTGTLSTGTQGKAGYISTDYNVYETDDTNAGNAYVYVNTEGAGTVNQTSSTNFALEAVDEYSGWYVISSTEDFITGQNSSNYNQLFLVDNTGTVQHQITTYATSAEFYSVDISKDPGGTGSAYVAYLADSLSQKILITEGAGWGSSAGGLVRGTYSVHSSATAPKIKLSDDGVYTAIYAGPQTPLQLYNGWDLDNSLIALQSSTTSFNKSDQFQIYDFGFADNGKLLFTTKIDNTTSREVADSIFEYDYGSGEFSGPIRTGLQINQFTTLQDDGNGQYYYAYSSATGAADQNDIYIEDSNGFGAKAYDSTSATDVIGSLSLAWNSGATHADLGIYGQLSGDSDQEFYRINSTSAGTTTQGTIGQNGFMTSSGYVTQSYNQTTGEYSVNITTNGVGAVTQTSTTPFTLEAVDSSSGWYVISSTEDFLAGQNASNYTQLFLVDSSGTVQHQLTNYASAKTIEHVDMSKDPDDAGAVFVTYAEDYDRAILLEVNEGAGWGGSAGPDNSTTFHTAAGRIVDTKVSDDGSHAIAGERFESSSEIHMYDGSTIDSFLVSNFTGARDNYDFIDNDTIAILGGITSTKIHSYTFGDGAFTELVSYSGSSAVNVSNISALQANEAGEYYVGFWSGSYNDDVIVDEYKILDSQGNITTAFSPGNTEYFINNATLAWNEDGTNANIGIYGIVGGSDDAQFFAVNGNNIDRVGIDGYISTNREVVESDNTASSVDYVYFENGGISAGAISSSTSFSLKAVDEDSGWSIIESTEDFITGQNSSNYAQLFLVDDTGVVQHQITNAVAATTYGSVDLAQDPDGAGTAYASYSLTTGGSSSVVRTTVTKGAGWGGSAGGTNDTLKSSLGSEPDKVKISNDGTYTAYGDSTDPGKVFLFNNASEDTFLSTSDAGFDDFGFVDSGKLLLAQDTDANGYQDSVVEYTYGDGSLGTVVESGLDMDAYNNASFATYEIGGGSTYYYTTVDRTSKNIALKDDTATSTAVHSANASDIYGRITLADNGSGAIDVGVYGLLNDLDSVDQLYRFGAGTGTGGTVTRYGLISSSESAYQVDDLDAGTDTLTINPVSGTIDTLSSGTDFSLKGINDVTGHTIIESTEDLVTGQNSSNYNQLFLVDADGTVVHQITNNTTSGVTYGDADVTEDNLKVIYEYTDGGGNTVVALSEYASLGSVPSGHTFTAIETHASGEDLSVFDNISINHDGSYIAYRSDSTGTSVAHLKDTATMTSDATLAADSTISQIGFVNGNEVAVITTPGSTPSVMQLGDNAASAGLVSNVNNVQQIVDPNGSGYQSIEIQNSQGAFIRYQSTEAVNEATGYSLIISNADLLGQNGSGYNQVFLLDEAGTVLHQVTNFAANYTIYGADLSADDLSFAVVYEDGVTQQQVDKITLASPASYGVSAGGTTTNLDTYALASTGEFHAVRISDDGSHIATRTENTSGLDTVTLYDGLTSNSKTAVSSGSFDEEHSLAFLDNDYVAYTNATTGIPEDFEIRAFHFSDGGAGYTLVVDNTTFQGATGFSAIQASGGDSGYIAYAGSSATYLLDVSGTNGTVTVLNEATNTALARNSVSGIDVLTTSSVESAQIYNVDGTTVSALDKYTIGDANMHLSTDLVHITSAFFTRGPETINISEVLTADLTLMAVDQTTGYSLVKTTQALGGLGATGDEDLYVINASGDIIKRIEAATSGVTIDEASLAFTAPSTLEIAFSYDNAGTATINTYSLNIYQTSLNSSSASTEVSSAATTYSNLKISAGGDLLFTEGGVVTFRDTGAGTQNTLGASYLGIYDFVSDAQIAIVKDNTTTHDIVQLNTANILAGTATDYNLVTGLTNVTQLSANQDGGSGSSNDTILAVLSGASSDTVSSYTINVAAGASTVTAQETRSFNSATESISSLSVQRLADGTANIGIYGDLSDTSGDADNELYVFDVTQAASGGGSSSSLSTYVDGSGSYTSLSTGLSIGAFATYEGASNGQGYIAYSSSGAGDTNDIYVVDENGSQVNTYDADAAQDTISKLSLALNSDSKVDVGVFGVLTGVNGDTDNELYRFTGTPGEKTIKRSRILPKAERIFDGTYKLTNPIAAHLATQDLEELKKQIEENIEVIDDVADYLEKITNTVRGTGLALLNLSEQINDGASASEVARKLRASIMRQTRGQIGGISNLDAITVATLVLDDDII